tara:strand:- start:176 stop:1036 length:861 start_codon:yes stop_codon:yes gene_type:complete
MDILTAIIEERGLDKKNTIKTYHTNTQSAIDFFEDDEFYNKAENKIRLEMAASDLSTRQKYEIINITIMFKLHLDRQIKILEAYRTKLSAQLKQETADKLVTLKLPSYSTYFGKINGEMASALPQKYIVNMLLKLFGLRNLDMYMNIVKLAGRTRLPPDTNENYMVVRKSKIDIEIRNYKTASSYGIKKLVINKREHSLLHKTITDYYASGHRYLLSRRNKDSIALGSLSKTMLQMTDGLGSGNIFKIITKHYREAGEMCKLQELAKSRGTDIGTIIEFYNANDAS